MENSSSSPGETSDIEKPAHILLIEDSPVDVQLLRLALDQQGQKYELKVLRDGAEALLFVDQHRTASISDPEPCVIILDLHIPKHGGVAVLQAIRRAPVLSHIHVLVLTSATSPEEELEARYLGVRLYREKPRDLGEFLQVAQLIFEICKKGQRLPETRSLQDPGIALEPSPAASATGAPCGPRVHTHYAWVPHLLPLKSDKKFERWAG